MKTTLAALLVLAQPAPLAAQPTPAVAADDATARFQSDGGASTGPLLRALADRAK